VKIYLVILCLLISVFTSGQSSVLSSGKWYKVGITETGLYKIDQAVLDALGVSNSVKPERIKLYGNGVRGILPQENALDRPVDLLENPIFISGSSDGSFDNADYILFYGIGPHKEVWTQDGFDFKRNVYSDTSFYFIRLDGEEGKRVQSVDNPSGNAATVVSTFNDHIVYEDDRLNIISSGRRWLGKFLSNGETLTFNYFIEGLSGEIHGNISVVNQSTQEGEFNISANSNIISSISVGTIPPSPITGPDYNRKGIEKTSDFSFSGTENLNFQITLQGGSSRGSLDRFFLTFKRELRLYGVETDFRTVSGTGELVEYRINNSQGAAIWNVTDAANIYEQSYDINEGIISFKNQSEELQEYVIFSGSDFPVPFVFGEVPNQNLRGATNFDGIIIAPPAFLSEANRLAQFHSSNDGLSVKVVTPEQIYNEFSSGRQDITAIRDYAKYVYENGGLLKYLLLFGDCSYDYKDRITSNTNFVPTYESRESFHPIFSYSSDDYYAFLEEEEGLWEERRSGDHTMEIGVGRLPVKTVDEATTVVNKIIYYSTSSNTLGKWRNELAYVADDGDKNRHTNDADSLSDLVDTTFVQYNISKLYLDAFEQDASKDLSPQAAAALKSQIREGSFIINFLGHGNEEFWTDEKIFTKGDINKLTNRNKLPIFVTATCEFGRHDDPLRVSGAEELLLLETGGGIALLTTSRPVFASTNFSLNKAFHESIFNNKNRLGDIISATKNNGLEGRVNRNFTLLGDPMMRPAFPKLDIVLEGVENVPDTLKALQKITLSGEIRERGTIKNNFNGQMIIGVFDVEQEFETLGQDPHTYSLRSNAIFRGEATVVDGEFEFSFIVPENISYQLDRGKISLYAWDFDLNIDAAGSSRSFVIGGTFDNVTPDNTPPVIQSYLNDESFENGNTVGSSSLFIAQINDDSGITTSRLGVVEGIVLEIGGQKINLNKYYTASPDTFKEGHVVYPLTDLAPGSYQAALKVWDTHNNSSTSTIEFNVSSEPEIFTFNEVAYPNPATDHMTFYFEHDREDEDLNVDFKVYDAGGSIQYEKDYLFRNSSRNIEIEWNLDTNSGQVLNRGVYYYKLVIKSNFDGAAKEIAAKLVLSE